MSTSLIRILQDNFKVIKSDKDDILKKINTFTYFHKYGIFKKYGFGFIRYTEVPIIFLSKYYLFENIGKDIELKQPEDKATIITLKDAFHTWILTKSEEKKAIYADYILSLLNDEKYAENLDLKLISSIIKIYDKIYNDVGALNLLNEIQEKILNDSENKYKISNKSEYLCFINTLLGFSSLISNNFYIAKESFEKANQLDKNQITPKFYIYFTDVLLGNEEKIKDLFYLCLNYDIQVLYDFILQETIQPILFYLENCVTYEIFLHQELERYSVHFENFIMYEKEKYSKIYTLIYNAVQEIKNSDIQNLFNQRVNAILMFIDNFIKNFNDNYNIVLLFTTYNLVQKFNEIKNEILTEVKNNILKKIETRLYPIDHQLQVKSKTISDLSVSKSEQLSTLRTEKSLKMIEKDKEIDLKILEYENELNEMDNLTKYNPKVVFTNSVTYSVILAMLVFILSSFYNCNGGETINIGSSLITSILTLLVALFFSTMFAGYAYFEKVSYGKRLRSKIKYLSENKSKLIENVADDYDKKIKDTEIFYDTKIDRLKNDITKLNEDKKKLVEETLKSHQKSIDAVDNKINEIISLISV